MDSHLECLMSSAQLPFGAAPIVPDVRRNVEPRPTAAPTAAMTTRAPLTNVRDSLAYRVRLPLTVICIATGVALTVLANPGPLQNLAARWGLAGTGFALVLAGAGVRLWALASIGERKTRQLVTTGLYSVCRNPLYFGTFLIVLGFLGLWQSLPMTILVVPVILLYRYGVVPTEEAVLGQHYGAEFAAYCARTPRWFPRLWGYVPEEQLALRSNGFRREAQSALWWAGLAMLSLWVCHLAS